VDRRISRLLLAAVLLVALAAGGSQAQLGLGALNVSFLGAGYFGYALPVANSALARQWAVGSGLKWQAAYNSAVIPVRMDLEHRQARAMTGRLEVMSRHGYAVEESPLKPQTVVSQEFLIPPSVPSSVMVQPRVCPVSEAGGVLRLTVRLYIGDSHEPQFEQDVEVLQLEPAHLYSLHLDGEPGIDPDEINPGNNLGLEPPAGGQAREFMFPPEMLKSNHYTISCLRQQVTLAPLAARDFAFVFADAGKVRDWPEDEQLGLAQFVIGGGHLCLYNATGEWQGFDLDEGALQAGRGVVLPEAGGFGVARRAVVSWLEGELTEFICWSGGAVAGWQPENLAGMENLVDQLAGMRRHTAPWHGGSTTLARRPGYLHPVWIYRETCRQAALEPWDYPEFTSPERDLRLNNQNLAPLDEETVLPRLKPYTHCVNDVRTWPRGWGWVLLALPLVAMIGGTARRTLWPALALALAATTMGGYWWFKATPQISPPRRVALVDLDQRSPAAAIRELQAAHPSYTSSVELTAPAGASIRRVGGSYPVPWRLDAGRKSARWSCSEAGDFVALSLDAPLSGVDAPVKVDTRRLGPDRLLVEVDTRGIGPGRECYLLHPLGFNAIPGGLERARIELRVPAVPVKPGLERLRVLEDFFDRKHVNSIRGQSRPGLNQPDLLRYLAERPGGNPAPSATELLCWVGLGQNPLGLRGMTGGQGIILTPLPEAGLGLDHGFMRLTFPLEGPR